MPNGIPEGNFAPLGKVGIKPKGEYVIGVIYKKLDVVTHNSNLYVALQDTAAEPTDDGVNWLLWIEGAPIATEDIAGRVKPDGETITVDADGTIHGTSKVDIATTGKAGIVKPDGTTITVDEDGTIHGGGEIPDGVIFINPDETSSDLPDALPINADLLNGLPGTSYGRMLYYDTETSVLQLISGNQVISSVKIEGSVSTATINVTTTEQEYFGKLVTCVIQGGESLQSNFSETGQVTFKVKNLGTYVITCMDASESVQVGTFGMIYNVEISPIPRAVINVTTPSEELHFQTVVCTDGQERLEDVFNMAGQVTFKVRNIGTYTITCSEYSTTVDVTDLTAEYSATISTYQIFGYWEDMDDSNPETRVHYENGTDEWDNYGFTPMRCVATNEGGWNMGSWSADNCWIIKYSRPCMVKYDGTIDYFLDPNDYSKKLDGTPSDVSNTAYEGNAMVAIPLIWVKRYTEERKQYHIFCNIKLNDDFEAFAHTRDDGSIEPYTFYPLFGGSLISGKCRSIAGQVQMYGQSGTAEINYCKANGELWNTGYYSIIQLRWELETLFTRSTNKQDACGYGVYIGGVNQGNLSITGAELTHGGFWGYGSDVKKLRKFLHSEEQMGARERINGWLYDSRSYVKQYGPYTENKDDYLDTGKTIMGSSGGYVKETFVTRELGEVPYNLGGSSSTYKSCAVWYKDGSLCHAAIDGSCADGLKCGGSAYLEIPLSTSVWHVTARPYCKAPLTAQFSDLEEGLT